MAKEVTKRSENYSQWYNDLVVKADLAEQSAVRGCMVIYIFFFTKLGLAPRNWKNGNSVNAQRQKALYYTLLFSFIANAMFNEVALSPNSCGLYFIEMAFIQSTMNNKNLYLQIIRNT